MYVALWDKGRKVRKIMIYLHIEFVAQHILEEKANLDEELPCEDSRIIPLIPTA